MPGLHLHDAGDLVYDSLVLDSAWALLVVRYDGSEVVQRKCGGMGVRNVETAARVDLVDGVIVLEK